MTEQCIEITGMHLCPDCRVPLVTIEHEKTCPDCGWVVDSLELIGGLIRVQGELRPSVELIKSPVIPLEIGSNYIYVDKSMRSRFRGCKYALEEKDRHIWSYVQTMYKVGNQLNIPHYILDEAKLLFWKMRNRAYMNHLIITCLICVVRKYSYPLSILQILSEWNQYNCPLESRRVFRLLGKFFPSHHMNYSKYIKNLYQSYLAAHGLDVHFPLGWLQFQKAFKHLRGKSPLSIASALAYYVTLKTDNWQPQSQIASFFGITEVSLRNTYKYLQKC